MIRVIVGQAHPLPARRWQPERLPYNCGSAHKKMRSFLRQICLTSLAIIVAGCAEAKTKSAATPLSGARLTSTSSTKFEGIGRVAYHRGQPCTPPIMFDFNVGFGQT